MKKLILFAMAVCCMGQVIAQPAMGDTLLVEFDINVLPHPQMDYTETLDTGNYSFDALLGIPSFYYEKVLYGHKAADGHFDGFSYSNIVDSVGIDSLKRRAAFPGSGHNHSLQYGIAHGLTCNAWYAANIPEKPSGMGEIGPVFGLYVTNTTYDVLSMLHGDSTAKKFGGISGNDPDWFLLTIKGYLDNNIVDSTQFYLADFRSDTPAQDYIVKDWRWVDLSRFGNVDSLSFSLSSSDTDSVGQMRTPAYFCLDDIESIIYYGGIHEVYQNGLFKIYPNPVASGGQLFLENKKQSFSNEKYIVSLYNISGAKVMEVKTNLREPLTLPQLPPGIYSILIHDKQHLIYSQKLLLQ